MLKNTKIGKHVIPKFLLGITLSVLTILILRSGLVGTTSSASASGAGSRPSSRPAQGCDMEPTGVETSDYWIHYKLPPGRMPDPQFDGKQAKLQAHRVRPVYAHGKCPGVPNRAIVLIHGRTIPGTESFDTRHPTAEDPEGGKLSLQESLAKVGIDTFAPNLLGYGRSTRFDNGLNDPCNASLPPYNADGSCSFAEGCDRSSNPGIFPLNQQTSALGVNPLSGQKCAHSSGYRFARMDVWADDVIRVIEDAIARAQPDNERQSAVPESIMAVRNRVYRTPGASCLHGSTDKDMKIAVSINNHGLFSISGWRQLSESAAMCRRLSGSAEVPASRLLWETSADPDSLRYVFSRGFGLFTRVCFLIWQSHKQGD